MKHLSNKTLRQLDLFYLLALLFSLLYLLFHKGEQTLINVIIYIFAFIGFMVVLTTVIAVLFIEPYEIPPEYEDDYFYTNILEDDNEKT
jgi:hypothetical protein